MTLTLFTAMVAFNPLRDDCYSDKGEMKKEKVYREFLERVGRDRKFSSIWKGRSGSGHTVFSEN